MSLVSSSVAPGIWYRLTLGGITGHKDLALDTGVILAPQETTAVADAIVRVFIDHGDRTNRNTSRLKYVLDAWGFDKFLAAVEEKLGRPLARVDSAHVAARPVVDRLAHIGVHAQKQPGKNWLGVALPVGRLESSQVHALSDVAHRYGDGDIRLTVWQNLLISGVADADVEAASAAIRAAGMSLDVSNIRAGLIACTGNRGCKFAASDTKGHALLIGDHLDAALMLDVPLNIHLTGCHHSCAQHYIGDVGLIGAKITINDDGDQVEGYHLHVGGGFAEQGAIGRLVLSDVTAERVPHVIEALLRAYLSHRHSSDESFQAFTARHETEALKQFAEATP
jgi:ferredoxin-nitrite reductase